MVSKEDIVEKVSALRRHYQKSAAWENSALETADSMKETAAIAFKSKDDEGALEMIEAMMEKYGGAGGGGGEAQGSSQQPGGQNYEKRVRETFKFFGRDAHWSTFTVYDQDYVVTFAHMEHLQWKAGDKVQLFLNDPTGSCPMEVQATVEAIYKNIDIVFLRLEKPLEEKDVPQRDDALFPGCAYVVCGSSNRSHIMPFSISHGCISTTRPDSLGHIRGDSPSAPGDSGGGCFSVDTGCLIAINLGNDTNNPGKAVLLPVAQLDALRASLPPAKTLCIWPPAS